jgi:hypothetical protein
MQDLDGESNNSAFVFAGEGETALLVLVVVDPMAAADGGVGCVGVGIMVAVLCRRAVPFGICWSIAKLVVALKRGCCHHSCVSLSTDKDIT